MRAIKSLVGLALLGSCSFALAQKPLTISEAVQPPMVQMELYRSFPSVDELAPPIPPHSIQNAARQDLRPAPIERLPMPPPQPQQPYPQQPPFPQQRQPPQQQPPNAAVQMAAHRIYQPPEPPVALPVPPEVAQPSEIVPLTNDPASTDPALNVGVESYNTDGREYAFGSRCAAWWHQSWYFRAEVLALQRTQGFGDRVLVESDAGAPLLNSSDFDLNLEPGVSALIGHRVDCVSAWEIGYFGAQQWNKLEVAASLNNLDLPGALGALNDFDNADVIATRYRSQMHNAEVNYLRDHGGVTWLAGFRYFNLDEDLRFGAIDNDGDVSPYIVAGSNNLIGGQVGTRTTYRNRCYDWELTSKAGVFGNDILQRQFVGDDDNAITVRNVRAEVTGFSFVGDINFSAHCQMSDVWRLRAGYNVLLVTGLALAPDQVDFTNTVQSGRDIDHSGVVFFHGLNVGIEALW